MITKQALGSYFFGMADIFRDKVEDLQTESETMLSQNE